MPWNCRDFAGFGASVNRMAASFSKKLAAMFFQMANRIDSLHA